MQCIISIDTPRILSVLTTIFISILTTIPNRDFNSRDHHTSRLFGNEYVLRHVDMGWLRLVGSLKAQVSFAKESHKRDDILQKRPIILRSLLIVATP